jgi:predicted glutamine amidotransferase
MIAKASVSETTIVDEMMLCPHSLKYLSENGKQPDNPSFRGKHRDGCGIAFIKNNNVVTEKRDREHAWDESYIQIAANAKSKLFIAHNRLTSAGLESRVEGSHPFSLTANGVTYGFSHNGTIYTFVDEAKRRNTSDSFLFFEHLVLPDKPNDDETVIERLKKISTSTSFSSATAFLINDGRLMVWRLFNEKEKFAVRNEYYTMYFKLKHNEIVFSSEPLDDEAWVLMPNYSLISVKPQQSHLTINFHSLL